MPEWTVLDTIILGGVAVGVLTYYGLGLLIAIIVELIDGAG